MTATQDPTPVVLVHLVDGQGLAVCEDLRPVSPYNLPRDVATAPCPLCAALAGGRLVARTVHEAAVQDAYDEGFEAGSG